MLIAGAQGSTHYDRVASINALGSMGYLGADAGPAVQVLLASLANTNPIVKRATIFALGRLKLEPELVLPALATNLNQADPRRRFEVVDMIKGFGPQQNNPALPELLQALNDSNWGVRHEVTNALEKIAPEVLTNTRPPQAAKP